MRTQYPTVLFWATLGDLSRRQQRDPRQSKGRPVAEPMTVGLEMASFPQVRNLGFSARKLDRKTGFFPQLEASGKMQ